METEVLTPNQIAELEASKKRMEELKIDTSKVKYRDGLDLLAAAIGLIEDVGEKMPVRIAFDQNGKVNLGKWC